MIILHTLAGMLRLRPFVNIDFIYIDILLSFSPEDIVAVHSGISVEQQDWVEEMSGQQILLQSWECTR